MKRKRSISILVCILLLSSTIPIKAMTIYGYYTWSNLKIGISAWAYMDLSQYAGAKVRIKEKGYDSGWNYGYDGTFATAEKNNNLFYTCYKYYEYVK